MAGLSTAYFLGKSGERSVIVLEQEKELGGHASGRNAGMLRQAVPDPVLATLARDSRRYFNRLGSGEWKGIALRRNGSLLLAKGSKLGELRSIRRSLSRVGLVTRWLSHRQVERKVSWLKGGDFSRALFCPSDATLELAPFLNGFLRSLRGMDIQVLKGMALEDVRKAPGGFIVKAGGKEFFAEKLVNAAGAWAGWVAQKTGAFPVPLQAYRRHLFLVPRSGLRIPGASRWPFVWDVSHDFYFRPTQAGLLLSPCDRTREKKGDRQEKTQPGMKRVLRDKLRQFSKRLAELPVGAALSGLRTMTPDGRFVVGEDPSRKGFY